MSDRDEIIRMARQANLLFPGVDTVDGSVEQLERFFHLAYAAGAAAERERIKAANATVIANINNYLNEMRNDIRARSKE